MEPESLVILDYSGTLSIRAPLFARPDHLLTVLARSGLASLGVDSLESFWNGIVNPTWEEGSTSPAGYISLMENRIRETRVRDLDERSGRHDIHEAASRFVEHYLSYSIIDPRWLDILKHLHERRDTRTVIATDHYAEATAAIIGHLKDLGIAGVALQEAEAWGRLNYLAVANSADLGARKTDPAFWQAVRRRLSLNTLRRVLIVDDFGAHEQTGDAYGESAKIEARRLKTLDMLKDVFHTSVSAIPFCISAAFRPDLPETEPDLFGPLITKASLGIRQFLNEETRHVPGRPD